MEGSDLEEKTEDQNESPAGDEQTSNETPEESTTETSAAKAPPEIEETSVEPPQPGEVIGTMPEGDETQPGGSESVTPAKPTQTASAGGKKRWLSWLLLLVVVAALAIGGWWYYKQHKSSTNASNTGQAKDVPLIRVGFPQADYGTGLYPNMATNDYSFSVNDQIFEGLVRYENKSSIVPDLASDWRNPDAKTWIFTVKSGVKFHDGHTLTAKDVKSSLDNVIASKSDLANTFASTIASVDVTDSNKVKITTTDPDPTLLNKLTFLYIVDANLPKGDEASLAGTGPYEVKPGTTPTNKGYELVAFDGYHGGRPTTRAITFGNENDYASLVKAFTDHKYDIVGQVSSRGLLQQAPGAKQFKTNESDVDFIGFNLVKPGPLQNKKVREAIRYTINAKAIGESRGATVTSLSQMIPPSIPGYNPAIPTYKQDINKAKQLLTEAGYPNGLTLRYSTSSSTPETTAEMLKEFKAVGITLTPDQHQDFNEFINYFSGGEAEMFSVDYSSDTLDGLDIYTTTLSTSNYNNPKLTALFDQAATEVNPAKRLKLLQEAAAIIDQDIPTVPISTQTDTWLMNKNYVIQQDLPSSYLPVYFYKVHL